MAPLTDVREAARRYIARGWQVTVLEPGGKACIHPDWLTRSYAPEDFGAANNIGIKSFGGLVDVDCDCAEAIFMAETFLPKTPLQYGRKSRPRSHWLFRCPEITEAVAFKDFITGKNIAEIRVNHQSMAPPSIHPEGERVEWERDDATEMVVEKAMLIRNAQLMTTAAMVARYYNPPGARHDWGLALAGQLRSFGLKQADTERVIERAAKWNNDADVRDRLGTVRSTYALAENAAATGGKTLEQEMGQHGKAFVATLHKIWGNDSVGISKSLLEAMNAKHAVLFDQAGNFVVLTETTEDGRFQLRFSSPQTLAHLYPRSVQVGTTAKGRPILKKQGTAWLDHPKRRAYDGIELAPNGHCNPGYYNLWKGWPVEPKKGVYPKFLEHLDLVAQHHRPYADYIFAWMADCVQHPERPGGVALAFKGGQGVGKSTFAKWFGALFGSHFLHLDSEHRLLGNFNAHLHNAIVVLADEAVWAGGKAGLGALKRMITEDTLNIERKGLDVVQVKNLIHMLINSNEDWVVPMGFDNRRFAIFEVSTERQNDWKFFASVEHELFKEGGLAALLYDLQRLTPKVNLRDIPNTEAAQEQKDLSATPAEQCWFSILQQGFIEAPGVWPETVPADALHSVFIVFLERHRMGGRSPRATQTQFAMFLRKHTPLKALRTRPASWGVPSLNECRKAWAERCKWPAEYDWGDEVDQPELVPF